MDAFKEVIDETCKLVRKAGGKRQMVQVSPEVAAWIRETEAAAVPEPVEAPPETPPPAPSESPTSETEVDVATLTMPVPEPATPEVIAALAAIRETVRGCTLCGLHKTRTNTVFSDGHPNADLVFVGEAPGADEDAQGVPFVGRAGQLLTDIIVKGMRMRREDVYICNVLKCRPPNNRDPEPGEKDLCEPYLIRQLELIKPKVICALGTHAAQTLLKTDTGIGKLRGFWHFYHGIPLRATYHPAYLLRSPGEKKKAWEDIQAVMRLLAGIETPRAPESPKEQGLFS